MFKVKIGEDEYEVEFDHRIPDETDRHITDPKAFRRMFGTVCMISTKVQIAFRIGSADLSIKDNFNRNTGRKVALAKALQGFPKSQRKLFWQAYYQARGNKW